MVDHLRLKRASSVLDVVNRSFDNISVYIYWVYKARLNIACSHLFVFCCMVRFCGVLTESVKKNPETKKKIENYKEDLKTMTFMRLSRADSISNTELMCGLKKDGYGKRRRHIKPNNK